MIPDKRRAASERAANEETRAVALGLEPLGHREPVFSVGSGPDARHYTRAECEEHLRHDIEKAPT